MEGNMFGNAWRAAPVLLASVLSLSACGAVLGGDDDAASSATTVPVAPTTLSSGEPADRATATTAAAVQGAAVDEAPAEEQRTGPLLDEDGEPITVLHPELRPVIAPELMAAGPIQFNPVVCEITGFDLVGFSSQGDMATAGDRVFFAGSHGLVALTPDATSVPGGPCSLSADESMGPGGIMSEDDDYDRLSGNSEGRLLASGIFGTFVYDTHLNQRFECDDMSGNVAISSDGSTGYAYWVGEEVERWTLTDSICNPIDVVTYGGFDSVSSVFSLGEALFVSGRDTDGTNTLTAYQGDAPAWTLGSDDPSDPDWWANVEGVAPCGGNLCVTEWFGTFNVVDPSGQIVAQFDGDSAMGTWSITSLGVGSDGSLYLLAGDSVEHEFDGTTYFNWIIRLD